MAAVKSMAYSITTVVMLLLIMSSSSLSCYAARDMSYPGTLQQRHQECRKRCKGHRYCPPENPCCCVKAPPPPLNDVKNETSDVRVTN
uniref:Uncharacterized protein n=1 Tax=Oryza brachyantha TaxID=4533 RepID=J3NA76_ORYBR